MIKVELYIHEINEVKQTEILEENTLLIRPHQDKNGFIIIRLPNKWEYTISIDELNYALESISSDKKIPVKYWLSHTFHNFGIHSWTDSKFIWLLRPGEDTTVNDPDLRVCLVCGKTKWKFNR